MRPLVLVATPSESKRWSPWRTIAFAVIVSALLWAAIIYTLSAIL